MNEITTINPTGVEIQSEETMPHSIEAEQQLLGAILTNNDVYDRIASIIGARHFYEPVHARIFDIAAARIAKNNLASPVTLKAFMEDDEGLQELGGAAYLRGNPVERIYRETKVMSIGGGSQEIMRDLAARQMGL